MDTEVTTKTAPKEKGINPLWFIAAGILALAGIVAAAAVAFAKPEEPKTPEGTRYPPRES